MSLFEYIFADEIKLQQLRDISKTLKNQQIFERGREKRLKKEQEKSDEINDDIGLLSLLMITVIKKLIDKGVITEQELLGELLEIDQLDGLKDGQLDINVLRGSVGLAKGLTEEEEEVQIESEIEDVPKKKTFLEKMKEEESERKIVIKKDAIPKSTKMLDEITKDKRHSSHSLSKRTKTHKSNYRK